MQEFNTNRKWTAESWKNYKINHMPKWKDEEELKRIKKELSQLPALVFAQETRQLKSSVQKASIGEAFILQCGDCAESFSDCNGTKIHNFIKLIMQMATVISYEGEIETIKLCRIAGQYAKPRSSETELINDLELPTYKGDIINSFEQDLEKRQPDSKRMLEAYFRSTATLNLIRAFIYGGYSDIRYINDWYKSYKTAFKINEKYEELIKALNFMKNNTMYENQRPVNISTIYTSHEALLLDYEQPLSRVDTTTNLMYGASGHFLWLGERTRNIESAHVEFLSGINNPVGIKVGPDFDQDDLIQVIKKINPRNELGRITLITRFGVKRVNEELDRLIKLIKINEINVTFLCDPMHGNTFVTNKKIKTRRYEDILAETENTFEIHHINNSILGGIHLEVTDELVTECVGYVGGIHEDNQHKNYTTTCDPRLNFYQSVEFSFEIGKLIKKYKKNL